MVVTQLVLVAGVAIIFHLMQSNVNPVEEKKIMKDAFFVRIMIKNAINVMMDIILFPKKNAENAVIYLEMHVFLAQYHHMT